MTHIWCVFSLLESCAFDGERGRRGFVIEVKNNKATACWPALPVQDLDMNPMHYVCPLERARIQESMWLLILLSFCCLSSDPSSKIVTRTLKTEWRSANLTLRGCAVLIPPTPTPPPHHPPLLPLPLFECSWTFLVINLQRTVPWVVKTFQPVYCAPSGYEAEHRTQFCFDFCYV